MPYTYLVSLHQPLKSKPSAVAAVSSRPPNAFKPSAYDQPTLAFCMPGSCCILTHVARAASLTYLLIIINVGPIDSDSSSISFRLTFPPSWPVNEAIIANVAGLQQGKLVYTIYKIQENNMRDE